MQVDVFFGEDFVDVGTCATQLGSEPSDCTALVVECPFDEFSNVNHGVLLLVCAPTPNGHENIAAL